MSSEHQWFAYRHICKIAYGGALWDEVDRRRMLLREQGVFFNTWEEAHAWVMDRAQEELDRARLMLRRAQGRMRNAKGMKKPAEEQG